MMPNGASNQWQLDVNDFSLETQDSPKGVVKKWPAAVFSVSGQRMDDNALHKIALFVERAGLAGSVRAGAVFCPLAG